MSRSCRGSTITPATPCESPPTNVSQAPQWSTRSSRPTLTRVRHNGRLHHIGIGRVHQGTDIVMLINDLDIRVIATTGELLRHLTLDPTRDYQPTGRPPGPPPRNDKGRTR